MYKAQYKKWGFTKYSRVNKFSTTDPARRRNQHAEIPAQGHMQGELNTGSFNSLGRRMLPQILPRLITLEGPPVERYLYHIDDYVRGIFQSGAWSQNWTFRSALYGRNFESFDLALSAKNAIDYGHVEKAFRIIDFSFERLKLCMQYQSADTMVAFHSSVLVYYSFCPEVARQWIGYTLKLAQTYQLDAQPRYIMAWINQLSMLGLEDWIHFSITAINIYCESLAEYVEEGSTLNSNIVRARTLILSRLRNAKVAALRQEDLLSVGRLTLKNFGRQNLEDLFTKFSLAGILFDEGNYDQARDTTMEILQSDQIEHYVEVTGFCYRLLFRIANKMGDPEQAMLAAQRSLTFCQVHFGLENELTIDAYNDMEELLRSRGQMEEAEVYRGLVGDMLNQICYRLDQVLPARNRVMISQPVAQHLLYQRG